jgi:hypothetical protein
MSACTASTSLMRGLDGVHLADGPAGGANPAGDGVGAGLQGGDLLGDALGGFAVSRACLHLPGERL